MVVGSFYFFVLMCHAFLLAHWLVQIFYYNCQLFILFNYWFYIPLIHFGNFCYPHLITLLDEME